MNDEQKKLLAQLDFMMVANTGIYGADQPVLDACEYVRKQIEAGVTLETMDRAALPNVGWVLDKLLHKDEVPAISAPKRGWTRFLPAWLRALFVAFFLFVWASGFVRADVTQQWNAPANGATSGQAPTYTGWTVGNGILYSPTGGTGTNVDEVYCVNSSASFGWAMTTAQDGSSGNGKWGAAFKSTAGTDNQWGTIVFRSNRSTTNPIVDGTQYEVIMIINNAASNGLYFQKRSNGMATVLASLQGSGIFQSGQWYHAYVTASGNSFTLQAKRDSDGVYLTSGGSWGTTTPVTALTPPNDSTIAAAQGYSGVALAGVGSSASINTDDFTFVAASSALTAGSITTNSTTSTTASLTATAATGGTAPYTYQWYRSTTSGFTPGAGNIISGSTGLTLSDSGLSASTTYYYKVIATDSATPTAATVTYTQQSATTQAASRAAFHFYVAASPAGNDTTGDGSIGTPYATIGKINGLTLQPGDEVSFRGGDTFTGNLVIQQSGTLAAPIVIDSYSGQATISGGMSNGVKVQNAEYVTVTNLILNGSDYNYVTSATKPTNTGAGIDFLSTQTSGSQWRGCKATNCTINGFRCGILFEANQGTFPQSTYRGYTGFTIQGNDISHTPLRGIFVWSMSNQSTYFPTSIAQGYFPMLSTATGVHTNAYIADNYIHDNYGWNSPPGDTSPNGTNQNDELVGAGMALINTTGGIIERNLVTRTGHAGNYNGSPANFENEASWNLVYQYNESSFCSGTDKNTNDKAGMDCWDAGTDNVLLQYNYIHDNAGYGIGGGSISGYSPSNNTNCVARFNLLVNNNTDGSGGDIALWYPFASCSIYNNTVISGTPTSANWPTTIAACPYVMYINRNPGATYIWNNIFVANSNVTDIYHVTDGYSGAGMQGNLYWKPDGTFQARVSGTTYTSWSIYVGTGTESNPISGAVIGVNQNPNFVVGTGSAAQLPTNPVRNQVAYKLNSGSPARRAGYDWARALGTTPGALDFLGNLLDLNNMDIGCCQFNAIPTSTVTTTTASRRFIH